MTDQHPTIVPPLELKRQWIENNPETAAYACEIWLIDRAAQWGYEQRGEVNEAELQQARDEELEACISWMKKMCYWAEDGQAISLLRAARRPKPPSLKEQALEEVGAFEGMGTCNIDIIRRALEALPDKC